MHIADEQNVADRLRAPSKKRDTGLLIATTFGCSAAELLKAQDCVRSPQSHIPPENLTIKPSGDGLQRCKKRRKPVWHKLGSVENFIEALFSADQQLAEHGRKQGCRGCGGRLHRADYPRKVRGVPDAYEQMFSWRFSFCCAARDCRKRQTPPSVRFLGRRLYVGAVVVACCAGWTDPDQVPVARRTARRWNRFFRRELVASTFWQSARARLMPTVAEDELPGSLLERFSGEPATVLCKSLEFLAPVTTGQAGSVMDG